MQGVYGPIFVRFRPAVYKNKCPSIHGVQEYIPYSSVGTVQLHEVMYNTFLKCCIDVPMKMDICMYVAWLNTSPSHCLDMVNSLAMPLHTALWEKPSLCHSTHVSNWHILPALNQPIRLIQALYSLHISYTGCFWLLKLCSRGCRKTNLHTYMHTFFGKQFQ